MSRFFAIIVVFGSMSDERRTVPGRVAVGGVDIVGTGMSSPSSSPFSSSSCSRLVTYFLRKIAN